MKIEIPIQGGGQITFDSWEEYQEHLHKLNTPITVEEEIKAGVLGETVKGGSKAQEAFYLIGDAINNFVNHYSPDYFPDNKTCVKFNTLAQDFYRLYAEVVELKKHSASVWVKEF